MSNLSPRAHLRAVALTVVVAINCWMALPIGPRVTAETLKKADSKAQVDEWMSVVSYLGLSRKQFEKLVVDVSGAAVDFDTKVSAPIKPITRMLRISQSWALFSGADRTPLRLTLRGITADGSQRMLYRRLDADATFLGVVLDFRRVRGIYDLDDDELPKRYKILAKWLAVRAFDAYPDLTSVELVQEERRTALPGKKVDPTVKLKFRIAYTREEAFAPDKPTTTTKPKPEVTAKPDAAAPATADGGTP